MTPLDLARWVALGVAAILGSASATYAERQHATSQISGTKAVVLKIAGILAAAAAAGAGYWIVSG